MLDGVKELYRQQQQQSTRRMTSTGESKLQPRTTKLEEQRPEILL